MMTLAGCIQRSSWRAVARFRSLITTYKGTRIMPRGWLFEGIHRSSDPIASPYIESDDGGWWAPHEVEALDDEGREMVAAVLLCRVE